MNYFYSSNESRKITLVFSFKSSLKLEPISVLFIITVFTVFRLLTDFVCLYTYEFWLSVCKIVRSSVILLLPLFTYIEYDISKWFRSRKRLNNNESMSASLWKKNSYRTNSISFSLIFLGIDSPRPKRCSAWFNATWK